MPGVCWAQRGEEHRMSETRAPPDVEVERLAALSAAIQAGIDDVAAGNSEVVDNPDAWVEDIAKTVTTQSVA